MLMPVNVVSLFSGGGGLDLGFKNAGYNILWAIDNNQDAVNTYKVNIGEHIICADINKIDEEQIPHADVVIGGPPCQSFSLAGNRHVEDARGQLVWRYIKIISTIKPKAFVFENVTGLISAKNSKGEKILSLLQSAFKNIGYNISTKVVNAADYGVAQNRERVIFIGIRKDFNLQPVIADTICGDVNGLFAKQPYFTFGDAVSDLEFLEAGEKSKSDKYHKAVAHPEHVIRWLYNVPEGKSAHDNEDPSLRPPSGYNTTYKRQVWNEPGATVQTTFGMISGSNNVHPIATRSLTIREAMRLQSFPDSFKIEGKDGVVRTTIGNAVPPLLAYRIALFIKSHYIDHQ